MDPTAQGESFLEKSVFPRLINYCVHRWHIAALVVLWVGLLVIHNSTFELVGGNYTNGISAIVASIVLLQQDQHSKSLAELHNKVDDLTTPEAK